MNKNIYLLILIVVISSCSGGLYSHYPKVKNSKQTVKVEKKKIRNNYLVQSENLPAKQPLLINADSAQIPFVASNPSVANSIVEQKNKHQSIHSNFDEKLVEMPTFTSKKDVNTTVNAGLAKGAIHKKARLSLALSIIGWVFICFFFVPVVGLFLVGASLIIEIFSLIYGFQSLKEIKEAKNNKDNPISYRNRDEAMAAIYVSVVYLGFFIIMLLAILAILSLIRTFG
jgi:hypothetical protein